MALSISCLTEMLDCIPITLFVITSALSDIITTEVRPLGESVLIQTLFSALYTKLVETAENDVANRTNEGTALSKSSICTTLAEAVCSIDEDNKHTESIRMLIIKSQTYLSTSDDNENDQNEMEQLNMSGNVDDNPNATPTQIGNSHFEYDVDSNDYISDVICGDLLTTSTGKQSVKVKI